MTFLNLCAELIFMFEKKPRKKTVFEIIEERYPQILTPKDYSKKLPEAFKNELLRLERNELKDKLTNLAVLVLTDPKSLEELPIASEEDTWKNVEFELLKEAVQFSLDSLTDREKQALELRFGLIDGICLTFEEIGKIIGVSGTSISRTERIALKKLRHPNRRMQETFKDFTSK